MRTTTAFISFNSARLSTPITISALISDTLSVKRQTRQNLKYDHNVDKPSRKNLWMRKLAETIQPTSSCVCLFMKKKNTWQVLCISLKCKIFSCTCLIHLLHNISGTVPWDDGLCCLLKPGNLASPSFTGTIVPDLVVSGLRKNPATVRCLETEALLQLLPTHQS